MWTRGLSAFTLTLTGLWVAGLTGCQDPTKHRDTTGETGIDEDTALTESDSSSTVNTTDTAQPSDTELSEAITGITGLILGPDGEPAADVSLYFLEDYEVHKQSDENGIFTAELPSAGTFAVHLIGRNDGWYDIMTMVPVEEGEMITLETPFNLVEMGPTTNMTGQPASEVALTDNLWLTLAPEAIQLGFGLESLELGAVEAPTIPPSMPTEEVLAVWYLTPLDARSDEPMSVRITNRWSLPPGATRTLYQASYMEHGWVEAGEVTVSADGSELVGGSCMLFSTLVLADTD